MSRRSLSLPGRPSRLSLIEKKMPLAERKKVHWSTDLEEVIYFSPDSMIRRPRDVSGMRSFDRRVRMLRSRSVSVNKRLPLKATQTLTRSFNDVNSMLIRTGVNILSHQLERLRSRSDNLEMFDQQSNNRWNELLALYQKQMRDQLAQQEEAWVWIETSFHFESTLILLWNRDHIWPSDEAWVNAFHNGDETGSQWMELNFEPIRGRWKKLQEQMEIVYILAKDR